MKLAASIKIMRPAQWLKNLMLFFPPFLGGVLFKPGVLSGAFLPMASFCLASSATYVFNDCLDRENDAHHPEKRLRPIPAGIISPRGALLLALCCLAAALLMAARVSGYFPVLLVAYLAVSVCYSARLKEIPIVDLFCISTGFLLRLLAGGEAFRVTVSEWLFLSVFLLAIFLSTGKRLHESLSLGEDAGRHRKSLSTYPEGLLEGNLYLTGAVVLVTYTMYTIPHYPLVYTVPLCTFGLMRYIFLVKAGLVGDPTEALLKDLPLCLTSLSWALLVGWSIYR